MSTVRPAPGSTKWPTSASTAKPASDPTSVFSPPRCERCQHWRATAATQPWPLVHTDLRLCFDGNRYCAPARYVGARLTVKADAYSVTIYDQQREVASYARSWRRGQTFGAERFEKELLAQRQAAYLSAAQQRLITLLGPETEAYLRRLAESDRSLSRQIAELLDLVRHYDPPSVAAALAQAQAAGAYGADYIANILHQQRSPRSLQPPLALKDPDLAQLATDPLSLLDYDALILTERKDS